MVAGSSCPSVPFSFQARGIDGQGAVGEASRSQPTVADGRYSVGGARRGAVWSGVERELFFALLD